MKVTRVEPVTITYYYVTVDFEKYPEFRTDGKGTWELCINGEWERWHSTADLEIEFRNVLNKFDNRLPPMDDNTTILFQHLFGDIK